MSTIEPANSWYPSGTAFARLAGMSAHPMPHRSCAPLRGIASLAAAIALSVTATARAAGADLVEAHPGNLPLILTAPHDGDRQPDFAPRRGTGTTVRDLHTAELALNVARRIQELTGAAPYVVIARFARQYADANRDPDEAVETEQARPAYAAYHAQITSWVEEVRARFPQAALLVDVHGQGAEAGTVFIGTRNGLTLRALIRDQGPGVLYGPQGLATLLARRGVRVVPGAADDARREDRRFNGGYTVFHYGSNNPAGVDAIQLESGLALRRDPRYAQDLAEALVEFMRALGRLPATPPPLAGAPGR